MRGSLGYDQFTLKKKKKKAFFTIFQLMWFHSFAETNKKCHWRQDNVIMGLPPQLGVRRSCVRMICSCWDSSFKLQKSCSVLRGGLEGAGQGGCGGVLGEPWGGSSVRGSHNTERHLANKARNKNNTAGLRLCCARGPPKHHPDSKKLVSQRRPAVCTAILIKSVYLKTH